jgi:hypothetical protein
MSDKEVWFTWRHDEHQAYNVDDIKAGQTTKLPEREALRMQLNARGTIGKTLKPHVHDQKAFDKFMREERTKWELGHQELLPRPGSGPIGRHPAYPRRRAVEGWSA